MVPTGVAAEAEGLTTVAGESLAFAIQAKTCVGEPQQAGIDHFHAVASRQHAAEQDLIPGPARNAREGAMIMDVAGGRYEAELVLFATGKYHLDIYQLIPGGLFAEYFNDAFSNENNRIFEHIHQLLLQINQYGFNI